MIYLKVQENEYPAYISGRLIDRDWDGRASKSITLTMTHAQAAQLFTDGLGWSIVQRAALLPALRKLTEGYAALGAAAKKTLAGLIPELAALIEAAEDALR